MLGVGKRAAIEQHQRQLLSGADIVGFEPHQALQQRLGRSRISLCAAQLVKQRQRRAVARKSLEQAEQHRRRFSGLSRVQCRGRSIEFLRHLRPSLCGRRRPVESATSVGAQSAAAGAGRRVGGYHGAGGENGAHAPEISGGLGRCKMLPTVV
jgi:hypothetical protein